LDTTVLIAHLRGASGVPEFVLGLLSDGHSLVTTCVNVAEVERGLRPKERRAAAHLISRLEYLDTTPEAAIRAGRYQSEFDRRGRTLHTADALIAGTARVHGAVLLTDNVADFPMRDLRVVAPPDRPS
jgi:predicted nucleic acid-binding protein